MHKRLLVIPIAFLLSLGSQLQAGDKATFKNESSYLWSLDIAPEKDAYRSKPESGRIKITSPGSTTILGAGSTVNATHFELQPHTSYEVEYTHDLKTFNHVFSLKCADGKCLINGIYLATCCTFMDAMNTVFGDHAPSELNYVGSIKSGLLDGVGAGAFVVTNFPDMGGFTLLDPGKASSYASVETELINNTKFPWIFADTTGIGSSGSTYKINNKGVKTKINGIETILNPGESQHIIFESEITGGKPCIDRALTISNKDIGYYYVVMTNNFNQKRDPQKMQCIKDPRYLTAYPLQGGKPWMNPAMLSSPTCLIEDPSGK